jgi:hypothetical protein
MTGKSLVASDDDMEEASVSLQPWSRCETSFWNRIELMRMRLCWSLRTMNNGLSQLALASGDLEAIGHQPASDLVLAALAVVLGFARAFGQPPDYGLLWQTDEERQPKLLRHWMIPVPCRSVGAAKHLAPATKCMY